MSTENGAALAVRDYPKLVEVTGFSSAQINLVRQTVAPGASIVELAWYLYNAKRLGLEPTLDQIYLIKYGNNPAEIVVGINGYRAQAESSGAYAGSDDAIFEYDDVAKPDRPTKATVTVWKIVQGMRVPFTASARWDEFYPGDGKVGEQYRKRPHNQLAVRAESHALRKGFPYQTARLDSHEQTPVEWVEAAQADETHRRSPERARALAAQYTAIHGSDDEGTAFADQQMAPAQDAGLVTHRRDARWSAFTAAAAQARAEQIEVPDLDVPIPAAELADATETLIEMVAAKRADVAVVP